VLADDHRVVRSGLRLLLDGERGFEVVAQASNVDDAKRYVRGRHPHVLVLDLNMAGGSSPEAVPVIRARRRTRRSSCSRCSRSPRSRGVAAASWRGSRARDSCLCTDV